MFNVKRGFSLCFVSLLIAIGANAQQLRSPWDAVKNAPTDASYECPATPIFARTLNVEGYYTDKQYSIIDPNKLAAFNAATEGPTHLGQYASRAADAWLSTGSHAAAVCVYSLLNAAAEADAWDGPMPQNNGVYLQNWMLSGTAIAYLKVRNSKAGTPEKDARIQKWFSVVANRVREYFDKQRTKPGSDAWNNHMYWAGLAVAAQGIASNDQNAFLWGMAAYRMGVHVIQPDGSLIAEMNRAGMAEHYQLYALGALVMLAELAEANGIDMYAENSGAIHRLVKFSVAGLLDPAMIEKLTGTKQNLPAQIDGLEIGWAVPYGHRFPDEQLSALLAKAQWTKFWQWGGAPPVANSAVELSPADRALSAQLQRALSETQVVEEAKDRASLQIFLGDWCAQGDPIEHASIRDEAGFVRLANGSGASSIGQMQGPQSMVVPGWGSVIGKLSPDHSQIDWSNGTYWARCTAASLKKRRNLAGIWHPQGLVNIRCTIRQSGDHLSLDNGQGSKAEGQIDAEENLSSNWNGTVIHGTITPDGNHINWDNQTYWTRAVVYGQ